MELKLITVQKDGRVVLGSLAKYNRYQVRYEQDGTIILTPIKDTDAITNR